MDLTPLLSVLIQVGLSVLPWVVGVGAGVAIVSWSPLGRSLVRHFQARRQDAAVNEQLLGELLSLREQLGEVVERLDATDRLLVDRGTRRLVPSPNPAELADADRVPTPR